MTHTNDSPTNLTSTGFIFVVFIKFSLFISVNVSLLISMDMLLLLFAFQSMFISVWVSRLEIVEFPDDVCRSVP